MTKGGKRAEAWFCGRQTGLDAAILNDKITGS